jgi:hypothetical protein
VAGSPVLETRQQAGASGVVPLTQLPPLSLQALETGQKPGSSAHTYKACKVSSHLMPGCCLLSSSHGGQQLTLQVSAGCS